RRWSYNDQRLERARGRLGFSRGRFRLNTLLGSARRFPQLTGDREGVNAETLPPYTLISGVMGFAMVCAAKRDSEFVAHLEAQAAWLHEAKVMRIGGFAGADEARLL